MIFIKAKDKSKYKKSRRLTYMKPSEFLELSLPQKPRTSRYESKYYEKQSLDNLENRMKLGLEIDAPSFDVDIKHKAIVGHAGRHRAFTAHKLGISKIPVYMYYKEGPYYIEQLDMNIKDVERFKPKKELFGLSLR